MKSFAAAHHYRTRILSDGEVVLACRRGWIARDVLGRVAWVCLLEGDRAGTSHLRGQARKDPALRLEVEGDTEFIATFAEGDLEHVAERWAKVRRKRRLSAEQRAAAAARLQAYQFSAAPHVTREIRPQDRLAPSFPTSESSLPLDAGKIAESVASRGRLVPDAHGRHRGGGGTR